MRKIALCLLIIFLVGGFVFFFRPFGKTGQTRIVTKATTSQGLELYVIQKHTGIPMEPFEISFLTKRDKEPWKWYYIDHQGIYWPSARIEIDEKKGIASIFRAKDKVAELDLESRVFQLLNRNRPAVGPTELQAAPF